MAIKIVEDGPEITLTRSEHERLLREYQDVTSYMVGAPSFETWLRGRQSSKSDRTAQLQNALDRLEA